MSEAREKLTDNVKEALAGKGVRVKFESEKEKYSTNQFQKIYKGYDMLGNLGTVRTFIQKKYEIEIGFLEILLKLMALGLFTQREYFDIPKRFSYSKWKSILDSGYINVVMTDRDVAKCVYSLNPLGKKVVIEFYEYLSGEKKMPIDHTNPLSKDKSDVKFDNKKMELIKRLYNLPVPEHIKRLFQ